MGIQLNMVNFFQLLFKYIQINWIISIISIYFLLSSLLYLFFSINALIPCLWIKIFNTKCIGCGLTSAFIKLLTIDIAGAYATNPMIFLVLPIGTVFLYFDILKFKKEIIN